MKRLLLLTVAVVALLPSIAGAQDRGDRGRPGGDRPAGGHPGGDRPGGQPQARPQPQPGNRPGRPGGDANRPGRPGGDFARPGGGQPGGNRPGGDINRPGRPGGDLNRPGRPNTGRPDRPDAGRPDRPGFNRPDRPDNNRPGRPGGGFHRPASYRPPAGYWHGNTWNRPRIRWNNYTYPRGYSYRRWSVGLLLPALLFSPNYYYTDYGALGLYAPPYGYHWVRYGPDLLLVEDGSRRIVDVRHGVFD